MSSAAESNSAERDSALSLSLTETQEDASKRSAQAAALKAATITPRGFRALSGNITPWKPDLSKCHVCVVKFTFFNHRHKCRKCQEAVCNSCSRGRKVLRSYMPPKRVCDTCVNKFWAIKKIPDPDAAAAASATTDSTAGDAGNKTGDPRLSLTVCAPTMAGGMYASHTASLSPGTPAAGFFGPSTTGMNRGRRRLGSTSVESCLSLGTPSMLPPPTPAGGDGDVACVAQEEQQQQQQQAFSSPVLSVTDERGSGAFFGGRRESCGGKAEAVVVSGEGGVEEAVAVSPVGGVEEEEVALLPLSPPVVAQASLKEEDVKVASEVALKEDTEVEAVVGGGVGEEEMLSPAAHLMREMEVGGGGDEVDQGREEWKYSELDTEGDAEQSEEAVLLEGEVAEEAVLLEGEVAEEAVLMEGEVAEEAVLLEGEVAEEVVLLEGEVAEPEEVLAPVASGILAPVAPIAEENELDDIEDAEDADFVMPTASTTAAAAAVAAAVAMAEAAALLPAVLEEPAAEAAAVAAAAAAASVATKEGEEANVVLEKPRKIDVGGGKEGMMGIKTLACCGVVAFGVGLSVAVLVRSKSYGIW